jgi:hypothetical protein
MSSIMPKYNLTSLSSQDFEELVRDLLQEEWGIPLEAFRAGRDRGIDLRYAPAFGGTTIVQCKHFAVSGYSKLLTTLRVQEFPKIARLDPERYVVATSVALTPANKDEIVAALAPYVKSTGDIIGADDIEGRLARHPEVERRNFKLWLTSTEVLERVLHNAELCQTDFEIDRIRRKLPLFVQSAAYPRAVQLLDDTRIVIVSGAPGIGKTTLAETLLYAYLEQGYEPVKIQGEIIEGRRVFKPTVKQIFYYDDFLGQTFLGDRKEYLGRNEDVAIVNFMEMVRQSEHLRFVLTTREHILRNALQLSEKLAQSPVLEYRCILELRDYTVGQRARILYNHLYFSDLPQTYKEAILEDEFFLHIIRHEHFNPRLIEWLSSRTRVATVPVTSYQAYISDLLRNPQDIWTHAFRNQISEPARALLFTVYSLGDWTDARDLKFPFMSLRRYQATKYQWSTAPREFGDALEEMDGAFLSYHSGHASFLNPSIREFIGSLIANEPEIVRDIIESALRFKQIKHLWELSAAHPSSALPAFLQTNAHLVLATLARLLNAPEARWEKQRDGSRRGYAIDMSFEWRIVLVLTVAEAWHSIPFFDFAARAAEGLVQNWTRSRVDFLPTLRLLAAFKDKGWVQQNGGIRIYRAVLSSLLENLEFAHETEWGEIRAFSETALEWTDPDEARLTAAFTQYQKSGVDDDIWNCSSADEASELRDALQQMQTKFGVDFVQEIGLLDEQLHEQEEPSDDFRGGSWNSSALDKAEREYVSDDDIRQMFGTLRHGN